MIAFFFAAPFALALLLGAVLLVRPIVLRWQHRRALAKKRAALVAQLTEEARQHFDRYWTERFDDRKLGSPKASHVITPEKWRSVMSGLLDEYADKGLVENLSPPVTFADVAYDPEAKRITGTMTISSPEVLARMVDFRYRDGDTHDEVTAWLESCGGSWREAFVEVALSDGSKRWVVNTGITFVQVG